MTVQQNSNRPTNRFGFSEWSGAIGDLGTTLPLAFALVMINGFPAARIFLLWGLVYLVTGWYYKVPVSVQPLKAMAVIAITAGFSAQTLSSAAFFYGILFIILSMTGLIGWLQQWFSKALVRGIQLGIGLMLARKALDLIMNNAVILGAEQGGFWLVGLLTLGTGLLLFVGRFILKKPVALLIIAVSVGLALIFGTRPPVAELGQAVAEFTLPLFGEFWNILILLMIPQLPLTLGNAVYAANDACHEFWPDQSKRVSPTKLGASIGLSDALIGLLGGFPVCHGAGGIAAHARFGGKTGGTTMIIGIVFILLALIDNFSAFLFLIPVPILGTLLFFDSWAMVALMKRLEQIPQYLVAALVGGLSFITHNLALALLAGLILERFLNIPVVRNGFRKMVGRTGAQIRAQKKEETLHD